MTSRPSTAAPILAGLAIVLPLLFLAAYFGAYLACADEVNEHFWADEARRPVIERLYGNDFLESAFEPAAWLESELRGIEVRASTPDDEVPYSGLNL